MKKVLFMTLAAGLILGACSRQSAPGKTPVAAATETKPAAPAVTTPPVSNPAAMSDVPAGPTAEETAKMVEMGKSVFTTRCGRCHGLKNTADYDATRWERILGSMAPKAGLNDEETKQVKAYVQANCKK
jgi:mono/diheme cytochrome c family protein